MPPQGRIPLVGQGACCRFALVVRPILACFFATCLPRLSRECHNRGKSAKLAIGFDWTWLSGQWSHGKPARRQCSFSSRRKTGRLRCRPCSTRLFQPLWQSFQRVLTRGFIGPDMCHATRRSGRAVTYLYRSAGRIEIMVCAGIGNKSDLVRYRAARSWHGGAGVQSSSSPIRIIIGADGFQLGSSSGDGHPG